MLSNLLKIDTSALADKHSFFQMNQTINDVNINAGKLLANINFLFKKEAILADIHEAEFKVFSQWGDDGIINFLCSYLDIPNKVFIEFGVENYTECNTRLLLMNDNWSGLIMDGSAQHMQSVRNENIYWKYDLTALDKFVTKENINSILTENKITGEVGLLHIDIDGNDYWIWKEISVIDPIIVIVEYNSLFGFDHPWTIAYDPGFIRTKAHYSNLLYGTSLLSICDLAEEKGYSFIGCNSNGNNAYFVRKDKIKHIAVKTPEAGYVLSKFAESRNEKGDLTFLRNESRLELLKGQHIFNTRTNAMEVI
ncbi:MAG: hypothetical protein H7Z13_10585 [Ferruginibacter sp.]|nr:hypothetical protein [Ferruginibacter sp.]